MQIHVAQKVCEIHAGVVVGKRLHHGETRVYDGKLAPEGPLTRRRLEKALLADRETTEVYLIKSDNRNLGGAGRKSPALGRGQDGFYWVGLKEGERFGPHIGNREDAYGHFAPSVRQKGGKRAENHRIGGKILRCSRLAARAALCRVLHGLGGCFFPGRSFSLGPTHCAEKKSALY